MIVRILGEGQWEVGEEILEALNVLDAALEKALESGDEAAFRSGMTGLLDGVRQQGTRLEDDSLEESDFILPPADATIDEVRALMTDEGLVPD
jgi:hypothetical protein